jgi:hypothetical protein
MYSVRMIDVHAQILPFPIAPNYKARQFVQGQVLVVILWQRKRLRTRYPSVEPAIIEPPPMVFITEHGSSFFI